MSKHFRKSNYDATSEQYNLFNSREKKDYMNISGVKWDNDFVCYCK